MPQVEDTLTRTTALTRTTTFRLAEYAGEHNGWDREKVHPDAHAVVLVQANGSEYSLSVRQLEIFLMYAAEHPNMGSALDAVGRKPRQPKRRG